MRILWITNQLLPNIANYIGCKVGVGSGWLNELSIQVSNKHILCNVAQVSFNQKAEYGCEGGIHFYSIPMNMTDAKPSQQIIAYFEQIYREFSPDIIHIWGTEYVHSYMAAIAAKNTNMVDRMVISIQGLVSVYARHFDGYISPLELMKPTFFDLRHPNNSTTKVGFKERGKYEIEAIRIAKHVIGRTEWDYACTHQMNPRISYHFCNETLRRSFYEKQWTYELCQKHSIFVSQSSYAIKGLHLVMEALEILLLEWPDAHVFTTGINPLGIKGIERNRYQNYLVKLIKKYNLEDHITFLGRLDEKEMCNQFLKANVFVSASSIENSPNSVGEAMILGVPVVSSDVGGVTQLLEHNKEGFVYPADEPYMLAHYVGRIFGDVELANQFSVTAKDHARKTHDPKCNAERMEEIYREIAGQL